MARGSVVDSRRGEYGYEDEQGEQRGARLLREALEVAIMTLLLFILVHLVVQNYYVNGPSMRPTLHTSEYILVDKAEYLFSKPQRGDVIVFEFPLDTNLDYVKRVIGIPGDTVTVQADGQVTVDGVAIQEPYVNDLDNPYEPATWKLKSNQYFVLGDNRGDSSDSRDWGTVPAQDIIGKAMLVYWPFNDAHMLTNWSSVFSNVP
jgi:signal peptidase I